MSAPDKDKITREMVLLNKYGMHVRPAGLFAKIASRYRADVMVVKDNNAVSGKSIMALMTLEAVCGSKLKVIASGPDADLVLDELHRFSKAQQDFFLPLVESGELTLRGNYEIEGHYQLSLDDRGL